MNKPKTCKEALAIWDSGQSIFTVSMGGLGPGYEQCIHILAFEIIRDYLDGQIPGTKLPDGSFKPHKDFGESAVARCDKKVGGFSGAQVGAAKNLAYIVLTKGWQVGIDSAPKDRHIQVSKTMPEAPTT